MRRGFRRLHAMTQMALVGAVTLVILFVFLTYSFSRAGVSARENLTAYAGSLTSQVEQGMEAQYTTYAKILRMISFDKDVQSFLLCSDEAKKVELHSALKRALIEVATLSASITDIVVEDQKGQKYNLSDYLLPIPDMDMSEGGVAVSPLLAQTALNRTQKYIAMGKAITSIDAYNQTNLTIGRVYLILTPDAFTGDARTNEAGNVTLYLLDGSGQLLWSDPVDASPALLRRAQTAPQEFFYCQANVQPHLGYTLLALEESEGSLFSLGGSQTDILIAVSLALAVLVLLWVMWARNLLRPLTRLSRFIVKVQSGSRDGLKERLSLTGYQEAELIAGEFNTLLARTAELTDELIQSSANLYESRLLAKQSELAHLRSQINPHFLYNTLETMVGIAYTKGETELAEVARSLSLIFKYSIKGESIVKLQTEWKIAQNYINIQHFRFSDRFSVSYDLPEDCKNLLVPKLILQPMIENAVVHGIEQTENPCLLHVTASQDGQTLSLVVADNGVGMAPEAVVAMNRRLREADRGQIDGSEAHHIGILNVDSRIKLQYGQEYGVSLVSSLGRGTQVTIRLPVRKEEDHGTDSDRGR